jgi:hypothetical protein
VVAPVGKGTLRHVLISSVRKHRILFCVVICLLLLAHPALDIYQSYSESTPSESAAYSFSNKPITDRVVLIVIDSWAARIVESPYWMPKLFQRMPKGASGVLWDPKITQTANGILALSTGFDSTGMDQQRLVFSRQYKNWSIFDDVVARGQKVMFAGGPLWVALFGSRGTDNGPENGHGPNYRSDDLKGLARLEGALQSPTPPALSVLHISETDFAAHQYGTTDSQYRGVLHFWDDKLDSFLNATLTPGTTVIITADHGNDLSGTHGGSGDIYRRVPVLMWGAGISPGARFEMQAVDMPATIAVLLGIRAPANAVALPAVEALQIAPSERLRILRAAYTQTVLKNPQITSNPVLLAKAEAVLASTSTGVGSANTGGIPSANSPSNAKALDEDVARLRASFDELDPDLVPQRHWQATDWLFVVIAFLSVVGLLFMIRPAVPPRGRLFLSGGGLVAIAFLSIEALLVVRFTLSSALKSALAQRAPGVVAAAVVVLFGMAVLFFAAWRRRNFLLQWAESHVVIATLLGWLLLSAFRPVTAIGFVGLVTTLAVLHATTWTSRERLAIGLFFPSYFIVGSLWILPHLGERIFTRYLVGAPIALIGGALLFLAQKRRAGANYSFAWAMLAVLVVFPAGYEGFTGYSGTNPVLLASLMTAAFCFGVSRIIPIPIWVWPLPACVIAFWWFPQSALFYAAFTLGVGVLAATLLQIRFKRGGWMGTFVSILCLILLMSPPSKCLTLLVYCGALIAFLLVKPRESSVSTSVVLAALMIVGMYFAMLDLITGAQDGMLFLDLGSLDIGSAYVGDLTRTIVPAILIAVFKAWLLFSLLAVSIVLFEYFRQQFTAIAGVAGALLLLNVAQLSVLTAMSVNHRTSLYDIEMFSSLLTTGMFVFGATAVGVVSWSLSDRNVEQHQFVHADVLHANAAE